MHFSSFWEHPYSHISKPATWRHCKPQVQCSQGAYYHHKCFHLFFFSPKKVLQMEELKTSDRLKSKNSEQGKYPIRQELSAANTTVKKKLYIYIYINSSSHAKYPFQTNTFTNRKGINVWQVLQKGLFCWQKNWCLLSGAPFPTPFVIFLAGPFLMKIEPVRIFVMKPF